MKNFIKGLLLVAIMLAMIPLIPRIENLIVRDNEPSDLSQDTVAAISSGIRGIIDEVRIYDEVSGKVEKVAIEDFLVQAVMGSVSPDAEDELLQAQAVLMYTYILGKREAGSGQKDLPDNCDIGRDSSKYLHLVSQDEAGELFGDKAIIYIKKVKAAVRACLGEYLSYDGKPIAPAYCFSCGGRTESAEMVLGEDVPYLQSAECGYDRECLSEAVFTSDEVFAKLSTGERPLTLLGEPKQWLEITKASDSGYVIEVTIDGSEIISGIELAQLLELPSAKFTLSYSEEFKRYSFKIYGSGHLMGLSQFGANEMAKRGAKHKEILLYFFSGTTLERQNNQS